MERFVPVQNKKENDHEKESIIFVTGGFHDCRTDCLCKKRNFLRIRIKFHIRFLRCFFRRTDRGSDNRSFFRKHRRYCIRTGSDVR